MNLLLFLSAILSALTGVISGGRVADVQVERSYGATAQAQQGAVARLAPALRVRAWLALAGDPVSPAVAMAVLPVMAAPSASIPLYLDKPRE